jgi:hypothetical protein
MAQINVLFDVTGVAVATVDSLIQTFNASTITQTGLSVTQLTGSLTTLFPGTALASNVLNLGLNAATLDGSSLTLGQALGAASAITSGYAAALALAGISAPILVPVGFTLTVGSFVYNLYEAYQKNKQSADINDNYRRGLAPPAPRDPLAIDLAGNGIETVGITTTPILFDHNADGIRTGTGWIKATDAWLVLDRDGNGTIDSGRELFGVDTVLSGRPGIDAVYAATGFQALAGLNQNGDGLFNAADAAFIQGGSQFASVGGFLSNCS